jgi:hypothetical protein
MVDSQIRARLIDPAALLPPIPGPQLASAEVEAALRPFLDSMMLELIAPHENMLMAAEGPELDSVLPAGFAAPSPSSSPGALASRSRAGVANLDPASILLPASAQVVDTQPSGPVPGDAEPGAPSNALPWLAGQELVWPAVPIAGPPRFTERGPGEPTPDFGLVAAQEPGFPEQTWPLPVADGPALEQGTTLIDPAALLPVLEPLDRVTSGLEPVRPAVASTATPLSRTAGSLEQPAWLGDPDREPAALTPPADDLSPGVSWHDTGGEAIAVLTPRLIQAAERLEQAAERLAKQTACTASPGPRPFRGRVAD